MQILLFTTIGNNIRLCIYVLDGKPTSVRYGQGKFGGFPFSYDSSVNVVRVSDFWVAFKIMLLQKYQTLIYICITCSALFSL